MSTHGRGWRHDGVVVEFALNKIRDDLNDQVITKIVTINFHKSMVGTLPRPCCGTAGTQHHNTARTGQYVSRSMAFRRGIVPTFSRRNTNDVNAGIDCDFLYLSGLFVRVDCFA